MEDADSVVGRLVQPVDDPDLAARIGGRTENGQGEGFAIYHLRAAERENQSTW